MHPFLTVLVIIATVVHTVLGCCYHHLGACSMQPCASHTDDHLCDTDLHAEENGHQDQGHRQDGPCDHQCSGLNCVFARTSQAEEELAQYVAQQGIAQWRLVPLAPSRVLATDFSQLPNALSTPPARAHLLYQVWLI